ncbi:hypothetical protein MPC4_20121 [Methylocella tundrae]|uniref:Uncharacterized protein n=1 Tax=Methylocella tundrae TaxID=227605 RepID=A0A8B6M4H3_METTU|nr:hypothetical protein MPC4_20121 [Methylocella tundrae]
MAKAMPKYTADLTARTRLPKYELPLALTLSEC